MQPTPGTECILCNIKSYTRGIARAMLQTRPGYFVMLFVPYGRVDRVVCSAAAVCSLLLLRFFDFFFSSNIHFSTHIRTETLGRG